MRDSRPQLLDSIFEDTKILQNVQQRAGALLKLNNAIQSLLPTQLKPHCRVANYRNNILIIETDSANWLMGLRYEHAKILSTLRADILPSLVAINITINPFHQVNNVTIDDSASVNNSLIKSARKISPKTALHLRELALHCPERLRQKLEKLAALAGESANTASLKK